MSLLLQITVCLTLTTSGALLTPPILEACRSGEQREAWRNDLLVIKASDVAEMIRLGSRVVLVDVREEPEYAEYHIPGALLAPVRQLHDIPLETFRNADLVLPYCYKDLRGFEAARVLERRGVGNLGLFEGFGIRAWEKAGLPTAGTYSGLDEAAATRQLMDGSR